MEIKLNFLVVILASLGIRYIHGQTSGEFEEDCVSNRAGVAIKGQCFFLTKTTTTFNDAFDLCQSLDAKLAQIQTVEEYEAMKIYLQSFAYSGPFIALKRPTSHDLDCKSLYLNETYWCDTPKCTSLLAEDTFLRILPESASDKNENDEHCFNLQSPTRRFNDMYCDKMLIAVCQITDLCQSFRLVPNTCLDEKPIKVIAYQNVSNCAKLCVRNAGCRSFNVFMTNMTCQMLPWSTADGPKTIINSNCFHYTSV